MHVFHFEPFVDDWQKGWEVFEFICMFIVYLYACLLFTCMFISKFVSYWYQEFLLKIFLLVSKAFIDYLPIGIKKFFLLIGIKSFSVAFIDKVFTLKFLLVSRAII